MTELPNGFTASGIACGLKPSGKPDLGLLVSEVPAVAAGVFTTNRVQAAPVQVTRRHVRRGSARAIVVNSGNANACTGKQGSLDAREMAQRTAKLLGVNREKVLVASTGVIGQRMDMETVGSGIDLAFKSLSPYGVDDLATSIMTTDTRPKVATATFEGARIVGLAKGAGMMAPELATMLVFIATDAPVERGALHESLRMGVYDSFEMLNLDGCMSTNDTVVALANGAAGGEAVAGETPRAAAFNDAIAGVCASLAEQIADDGEGMTKLVRIRVQGATKPAEARRAAQAVANSVLLRCAINGADPYWGRVLAALGTSKIPFDPNNVDVWFCGEKLCEGGTFGPGDTERARAAMRGRNVDIAIDMHRGSASALVLTNDLSVEYVRFNTEYTT